MKRISSVLLFLVFAFAVSPAHACIFSGGTISCETDCGGEGGDLICTDPIPNPMPNSPDHDEEGWSYHLCPYQTTTTGDVPRKGYASCQASGGCGEPLFDPHFPGASKTFWDSFLAGRPEDDNRLCTPGQTVDSGWGVTLGGVGPCSAASPQWKANIQIEDGREIVHPDYETVGPGGPDDCVAPVTNTFKSWVKKTRGIGCPTGFALRQTGDNYQCIKRISSSCPVTNSGQIELPEGFESHKETDLSAAIIFGRQFSASIWRPTTAIAPNDPGQKHWQHTYERRLFLYPNGRVLALRQDHRQWLFKDDDTLAVPLDGPNPILKRQLNGAVITGWTLLTPGNELEVYDTSGQLLEIRRQSEKVLSMVYSDANTPIGIAPYAGLLIQVNNERGRSLDLTYNANGQVSTAAVGTETVNYGYDIDGVLNSVIYPDQTARGFIYNESDHLDTYPSPTLQLTGIIDEAGIRIAHYFYDDMGRVKEEYGPTPQIGRRTMQYFAYSYLKVIETDPLGAERERRYSLKGGAYRNTYNFDGCSSCGAVDRTSINYNSAGVQTSVRDAMNNLTLTTHDPVLGVETYRRDPVFNKWNTTWDPVLRRRLQMEIRKNHLLTVRNQWTYNARGQVLSSTQTDVATAATRVTTRTYCDSVDLVQGCPIVGLLRTVDGPRTDVSDITTYEYHLADAANCVAGPGCDHRAGDLLRVTNAAAQSSEYLQYDLAGRVQRMADANGIETHVTYDTRGRLTSRRVCAAGTPAYPCTGTGVAQTTMTYTQWGGVGTVTQADGRVLTYGYDDAHRLTSITDGLGNSIVYTLDPAGNRTAEQTFDPNQTLKRAMSRQFSEMGELEASLNAQANATQYTYDPNGNRETSTDALGVVTDNDYDRINRLIKTVQDKGTTSDIQSTIQYAYDERSNLTKVTDPKGLKTEYFYNGFSDQIELRSPDTGTTTYEFDSAGNRSAQVDARSVRTEYDYDLLNRLTTIRYPADTSKNIGFVYDQLYATECPTGSSVTGRLSRFTDHSGQTTLCYDHRGNVTRKVQVTAGVSLVTAWTYDLANRVSSTSYPSGLVVNMTRDTLGRINGMTLAGATLAGGGTTLISGVTYEPFGPIAQITYGDGHTQNRSYDQNYWITELNSSRTTGLDAYFDQDAVGNIVKLSSQPIGSGGGSGTDRTIAYDDLYRLTDVQDRNSVLIEQFSYDDTGNRLSKTSADVNAEATGAYAYGSTDHRLASVGGVSRSYDVVGNLTAIAEPSNPPGFVFDERNRLVEKTDGGVSQLVVDYNGRGERVWRSAGGVNAYDESGQLVGEYDGTGALVSEVVWLDSLPVGVLRGTTVYPVEADHLGSPRVVADGATAIWHWDLVGAVFGDAAPNEDPDGDSTTFEFDLRFPGQQWDAVSGLSYNYFRDYESGTGRYVESDPIGLNGGVATYTYARSDVLARIDAFGLRDADLPFNFGHGSTNSGFFPVVPEPGPPPANCRIEGDNPGCSNCEQIRDSCLSVNALGGNLFAFSAACLGGGIGRAAGAGADVSIPVVVGGGTAATAKPTLDNLCQYIYTKCKAKQNSDAAK